MKIGLVICAIGLLFAFATACRQAEEVVVETTVKVVEVTRVVTDTSEEEGGAVVVTRLVTRIVEVVAEPVEIEPSQQPVTLSWNWGVEPPVADPALPFYSSSTDLIANLFVGLTRFHPETSEVIPYLATEWESGEDASGNQTWTFHLRNNIAWVNFDRFTAVTTQEVDQDGNPRFVNAHDVAYGLKRTIDPATESDGAYVLYIIQNAAAVNGEEDGFSLDDIGVVALDDFTVQFTFETRPVSSLQLLDCGWPIPCPAGPLRNTRASGPRPA